jgi:hypothetical protein
MRAVSDVSIEFAHLYLANVTEQQASASARAASRWLAPVLDAYERSGLAVSTVLMVDDYFAPAEVDIDEKVDILSAACADADMRVDHIVYEAACAESIAEMQTHLFQEPRKGDGSSSPPLQNIGAAWLSNGDPPRGQREEGSVAGRLSLDRPSEDSSQETRQASPRGQHSIHLDLQLWKSKPGDNGRLWACPTIAAWWQLIRLGMLQDDGGRPIVPPRTRSRAGASPLPARRTLTFLDSRFLEIEHATRTILERVITPEAWRRYLREGEDLPDVREHLDRIAYMFVPPAFEPA